MSWYISYDRASRYSEEELDEWDRLEKAVIEAARATDPMVQLFEKNKKAQEAALIQDSETYCEEPEPEEPEEKENVFVKKGKKQDGITFYAMVYLALLNSGKRGINVQEMYAFIQRVFLKYRYNEAEAWRSSVRHQLATYKSSLIQEENSSASLYKLKDEKTPLHFKFERFCNTELDLKTVALAEDISWKVLTEGLFGIPKVEKKEVVKCDKPRQRLQKRKATEEEADAVEALLGLQKKPRTDERKFVYKL